MLKQCLAIEKGDGNASADFSQIIWEKVDVFALGVTFFTVFFYKTPLQLGSASKDDPSYGLICE
jgi:hypothetical protein